MCCFLYCFPHVLQPEDSSEHAFIQLAKRPSPGITSEQYFLISFEQGLFAGTGGMLAANAEGKEKSAVNSNSKSTIALIQKRCCKINAEAFSSRCHAALRFVHGRAALAPDRSGSFAPKPTKEFPLRRAVSLSK